MQPETTLPPIDLRRRISVKATGNLRDFRFHTQSMAHGAYQAERALAISLPRGWVWETARLRLGSPGKGRRSSVLLTAAKMHSEAQEELNAETYAEIERIAGMLED